jgi:anti-sigma B factor antagonist
LQVEFRMSAVGDVTILNLAGDFWGKSDEVDIFQDTIDRLAKGGKVRVVVNLAGVNIMNSTGIGMIIAAFRTFRDKGGGLVIAEPSESMKSIIHIQRWPLGIYDTNDEAVASFRSAK